MSLPEASGLGNLTSHSGALVTGVDTQCLFYPVLCEIIVDQRKQMTEQLYNDMNKKKFFAVIDFNEIQLYLRSNLWDVYCLFI